MARARRESQEKKRQAQLEKLLEVSLSISSTLHFETLLERIIDAARHVLQAEGASLLLLREDTGYLHFEHVVVPPGAGPDLVEALKGLTLELGEGVAGMVAATRQPLIISDTSHAEHWSNKADTATGYTTRDVMCVPLLMEDRTLGVLEVVNKTEGSYTEDDLPLCMALANMAAATLYNAALHRRLQQAHDRLQEMESTRTQYISTVSHELRTPITVIKGYSQVLEQFQERLDPGKRDEYLRTIEREADHLNSLIDDLFVVNEIEQLPRLCNFLPIELGRVVRRSVDHWSEMHPHHKFGCEAREGLIVAADQRKILHCLYHLLDNATKFSKAGSTVQVALAPVHGGVDLSVRDEGCGITPAAASRVFDPFWQADSGDTRQYGGLGLGLYIVSKIVEVHHGKVTLDSRPGEGSTFRIFLPDKQPGGLAATQVVGRT